MVVTEQGAMERDTCVLVFAFAAVGLTSSSASVLHIQAVRLSDGKPDSTLPEPEAL